MSTFKVGDVCIWQNCAGRWAYLNGTEATVCSAPVFGVNVDSGELGRGYLTDTPDPLLPGSCLIAQPWELRKKHPPTTGEQLIREMFDKAPERVEEPA